jgi:hypothetical protein
LDDVCIEWCRNYIQSISNSWIIEVGIDFICLIHLTSVNQFGQSKQEMLQLQIIASQLQLIESVLRYFPTNLRQAMANLVR